MKNKDIIAFSLPNSNIYNSVGRIQLSKTTYKCSLLLWGTDLIKTVSNKKQMLLDADSKLYYYSLSDFKTSDLIILFNASARLRRFVRKYCKNIH